MGPHPRYPVYVISKGRADTCLTAKSLWKDRVDYKLVVEPQEHDAYAVNHGAGKILTLPFSNLGQGSIPARNWVWEHAKASGAERHWILDDNLRDFRRFYRGRRIPCSARVALSVTEDFVDRYENVAVAGLNYTWFVVETARGYLPPPFIVNVRVYSCMLIQNSITQRWRGRYNEDTDLCLQVLSAGYCTILMNAFNCWKIRTMTMKGGNTADLYQGDGRLKMARSLQRAWPGVVEVRRRFRRPQHAIKNQWKGFDTPLRRKPDAAIPADSEQGIALGAVRPVRAESLRRLLEGVNDGP